jgi:hypothetical protein
MKRLIFLFLMFGSSSAIAQADPTFNGMAKLLHCSAAHRAICSGEYCSDLTVSMGENNIWIDIQNRLIGNQFPLNSSNGLPIRMVEVSEASFNTILFEKLEIGTAEPKQMLINFHPGRGQGMDVRFGIVTKLKSVELTKGLTADRLIETGHCEIQ